MSLAKLTRALWRGFQKVVKPSLRSSGTFNGGRSEFPVVSKQLSIYANSIGSNFAAKARQAALNQFLYRSGRRLALYSFVGFCMIDTNKDEVSQPDLSLLLQAFQGGFLDKIRLEDSTVYPSKIEEYDIHERLGRPSSFGAVYCASQQKKEVAVKMMFNLNTAPNASAASTIMQGFKREYSLLRKTDKGSDNILPKHPNIINVLNTFVDDTKLMTDSLEMYPYMLPTDIFQDGCGRKKTLFMVMPKYPHSLKSYLEEHKFNLTFEKRFYLFCQLLEAVAHLEKNEVCHRDMKADNILIDTTYHYPRLVLADFGSCFDGSRTDMKLSYQTEYVDKGGNPALLAPEILDAAPGMDVVLDYKKADVWAAGSIAYEIFGQINPLYIYSDSAIVPPLRSGNYVLDFVVKQIMQTKPEHRLSAVKASNVLTCLFYDLPLIWFLPEYVVKVEQMQLWLLEMSFKFNRCDATGEKDCQLFETFVSRTNVDELTMNIQHFKELMTTK